MTGTEAPATTWFSTAWAWVKRYWALLVLVAAGIWVWFFLRGKSDEVERLLSLYQKQSDDSKKQLEDLRKLRDEEEKRRMEIEETFQTTVSQIRKEHEEQLRALTSQKKEELKKIIAETDGGNPDLLAERINGLFGIPVVSAETFESTRTPR